MLAVKVSVLRNEKTAVIPEKEIIEGGIIQLQAGDIVPADCLLPEGNELHTNETGITALFTKMLRLRKQQVAHRILKK